MGGFWAKNEGVYGICEAHFAQSLLTLGIEWSAVDQAHCVLAFWAFGSASMDTWRADL